MTPILEVTNLRTYFHGKDGVVPAVDGISFSVEVGQTLSIVGESGCGKSVTALSILQLMPTHAAHIETGSSIRLRGEELLGKTPRQMCEIRGNDIAMIFQDPMTSLNPVMTIGRQLSESFMAHKHLSRKDAWAQSIDMLKKVGIPAPEQRVKEYPHQLSGGMKQRVMIAMALSCQPSLLIADEPTTALDVTIQAQILELMAQIKQQMNTAILLITHDMGVVAEMSDQVLVMYAGHLMEYASATDLFQNPLHPYTQGLLASIPRLDQEVEHLHTIKGNVPNLYDMPRGCRFCTRCPHAEERCFLKEPGVYLHGNSQVKCFLYER